MTKKTLAPTGAYKNLSDLIPLRDEAKKSFGKTDKYTTGNFELDKWLGGGIGKEGAFEIVTIFAQPGIGKSTIALYMLVEQIRRGTPIGMVIAEDDLGEMAMRLTSMFDSEEEANHYFLSNTKSRVMPPALIDNDYTLDDVEQWIRVMANNGVELFLVDNLQFIFDDAVISTKDGEQTAQRRFMKHIATLAKELKLTVILISHTNKDKFNKGMGKILGTSAIGQTATKVLEINRVESSDNLEITQHKNRYARKEYEPIYVERDGYRILRIAKDLS